MLSNGLKMQKEGYCLTIKRSYFIHLTQILYFFGVNRFYLQGLQNTMQVKKVNPGQYLHMHTCRHTPRTEVCRELGKGTPDAAPSSSVRMKRGFLFLYTRLHFLMLHNVYIFIFKKYNDKPKSCVTRTHFYMKRSSEGQADSVWLSGDRCWKQYELSPVADCVPAGLPSLYGAWKAVFPRNPIDCNT